MPGRGATSRRSSRARRVTSRTNPIQARPAPPATHDVVDVVSTARDQVVDLAATLPADKDLSREGLRDLIKEVLSESVAPAVQDTVALGFDASSVPAAAVSALGESNQVLYESIDSMQTSVGSHVPERVRARIARGEFVDMAELLFDSADTKYTFSVTDSATPTIQLRPVSTKQILTIDQWETAFRIFVAFHSLTYPHDTAPLMKYWEVVKRLANDGHDWKFYDINFRRTRQSRPLPWNVVHSEFYLRATSRPQSLSLPQRQNARHSFLAPLANFNKGICWAFERLGQCKDPANCQYRHACQRCGGPHSSYRCQSRV